MNKKIRWKQRFENFKSSFRELQDIQTMELTKSIERSGYIKTFEVTFELAWKTLKDFLESEGFDTPSPRKTIQQAFQSNYIQDGHSWIDALEKRNLLAYTYSEKLSVEACTLIREKYFQILEQFYKDFRVKQ